MNFWKHALVVVLQKMSQWCSGLCEETRWCFGFWDGLVQQKSCQFIRLWIKKTANRRGHRIFGWCWVYGNTKYTWDRSDFAGGLIRFVRRGSEPFVRCIDEMLDQTDDYCPRWFNNPDGIIKWYLYIWIWRFFQGCQVSQKRPAQMIMEICLWVDRLLRGHLNSRWYNDAMCRWEWTYWNR